MEGIVHLSTQEQHSELVFNSSTFVEKNDSHDECIHIPENYGSVKISQGKLSEVFEFGEKKTYTVFREKNFSRFDFSQMFIENVIFENCILSHAIFENAILEKVRFVTCNLKNANFNKANLKHVKVWKSNFAHATFDGSIIDGIYGFLTDFTSVDFTNAEVTNPYIWIGNFKGANAKPGSGFRTKKGGDEPRYEVPVCKPPCPPDCRQPCTHNHNDNVLKMAYER